MVLLRRESDCSWACQGSSNTDTLHTLPSITQGGGDQFDNRHFLYSVECSVVLTLVKEWVWGGGDGI